ncbi:pyruvate dehydrogenase [acetyl-transferring]-phosphatase 1, mitochondrial-like [Glandiceps talaboti]
MQLMVTGLSRVSQWRHGSRVLGKTFSVHRKHSLGRENEVFTCVKRSFGLGARMHAMLTPTEVSNKLREHELSVKLNPYEGGVVTSFDTSQLHSNSPIEDRRVASKCLRTGGLLFGVFDGHAGHACAQAVKERLFEYIAVSLLQYDRLAEIHDAIVDRRQSLQLVKWYQNPNDYTTELMRERYRKSLFKFVSDSLQMNVEHEDIADALELAFVRLDEDISSEAKTLHNRQSAAYQHSLRVATSGSCSCVVYINGVDVYVANVGDSRAILGSQTDRSASGWTAKSLSHRHNGYNKNEIERIRRAHPNNETAFVIKNGRLLSELAPLRAFGDVKYKWSANHIRGLPDGKGIVPKHYFSPPYLISSPEVIHHRLSPNDKFLVLATDGLWDLMTKEKAVQLIGDHICGKETLEPFRIKTTAHKQTLADVNRQLQARQVGLASQPIDENVATHLVRHALGDSEHGISHTQISELLSLPDNIVRAHRDDISVYVIFFDAEKKVRKQFI